MVILVVHDSDVDSVVSDIAQVFDSVLERREPAWIAWVSKYLLGLAVFIREPEMPGGKNDDYTSHMRVQSRLFMRSIVNVHYLHILILECQLIMCWFDLEGILRMRSGAERQAEQYGGG